MGTSLLTHVFIVKIVFNRVVFWDGFIRVYLNTQKNITCVNKIYTMFEHQFFTVFGLKRKKKIEKFTLGIMDHDEGYEKKPAKKLLYYRKRFFEMSGLEWIKVKQKQKELDEFAKVKAIFLDDSGSDADNIVDDIEAIEQIL
jgi:hypothetical protein